MDSLTKLDPNSPDDEERLVPLARKFIDLREQLKTEAKRDPLRTPTPELLAKELGITAEELIEVQDFAENYLGEFEAQLIRSRVVGDMNHPGIYAFPYSSLEI